MTDTLLKVENLTKHFSLKSFFNLFGDDSDVVKAVDGISFGIERGETYGVVGESGSGKSTTLAAMIDNVNENRHKHIITIEDPVEYYHHSKKCINMK